MGSYIKPIAEKFDIYDGEPWTEMDVRDLTAASSLAIRSKRPQAISVGQGQLKKSGARPKSWIGRTRSRFVKEKRVTGVGEQVQ